LIFFVYSYLFNIDFQFSISSNYFTDNRENDSPMTVSLTLGNPMKIVDQQTTICRTVAQFS